MELLIGLISGAVGGNAAGGMLKNLNQGVLINSLSGIVGGGIGGTVLSMLGGDASGGMDLAGILQQVAGGGIGGGAVLAIVGALRQQLGR
ncbi:hypothetical protein GCM10007385_28910 [Tateyamaria omphalii]|uniref:hypothetical protein n=1 Tax=Tateyamaria omphalii TaxID=299262 RepID=UPI00167880A2|nr:hypothetical protein [Tateyamaria omphalii]GGX58406.1 hypothetical protein GCM10007385_28910 [Tateyamaria omphalii]